MLLRSLHIPREEFEAGTGWELKAEGACKGEICVPLHEQPGEVVQVAPIAEALGMPLVSGPTTGLWALGPATHNARALTTSIAPDLVLPDLAGNNFTLRSLLGQKVLVYAWAPY